MGDVRQDQEKRSADLLNLGLKITQKSAETIQKYEKMCNALLKNEKNLVETDCQSEEEE